MIFSLADRIRTLIHGMEDAIMPAIEPANAKAIEQGQFILRHLALMLTQLDHEAAMEMADLRLYAKLVRELVELDVAGRGEATQAAMRLLMEAEPAAAISLPERAWIRDQGKRLRQAADDLLAAIHQEGDPAMRRQAARAVLAASERQATRERAFSAAAGMDGQSKDLPPLREALQ
jgi:hypothetical protein